MLDPRVFKAYDVRGIYGAELDEEGAQAIGRAFVEVFEPKRIAVGHDMRLSSPAMAEAVIAGATEAGAEVLELGLVGTEMVYFAVGELGLDGGVAVTASHNPKEYTGMKIVRAGALPVGGESGLLEIRDRALADSQGQTQGQTPGRVQTYDVWHLAHNVRAVLGWTTIRRESLIREPEYGPAAVELARRAVWSPG